MRNIKLLIKTIDAINKSPELHDQNSWIDFEGGTNMCQTSMCVAGHTAVLAGAEVPSRDHYGKYGWTLNISGELLNQNDWEDGDSMTVSYFAKEKLGFNADEVDYIFYCFNNKTVKARLQQLLVLWANDESFRYDTHKTIYAD